MAERMEDPTVLLQEGVEATGLRVLCSVEIEHHKKFRKDDV